MNSINKTQIVEKKWGLEHIIVNSDYCGKLMFIKKNHRCSLHHHKIKDETFFVLEGEVVIEKNGEKLLLSAGDSIHIKSGDLHRFTGITDVKIIEFSTHDFVNDNYRDSASEMIGQSDLDLLLADTSPEND